MQRKSTVPEVLDVPAAAEYLQRSERTVRALLRQGRLPGRKIGNAWRLSKAGLDAWLAAGDDARVGEAMRKGEEMVRAAGVMEGMTPEDAHSIIAEIERQGGPSMRGLVEHIMTRYPGSIRPAGTRE